MSTLKALITLIHGPAQRTGIPVRKADLVLSGSPRGVKESLARAQERSFDGRSLQHLPAWKHTHTKVLSEIAAFWQDILLAQPSTFASRWCSEHARERRLIPRLVRSFGPPLLPWGSQVQNLADECSLVSCIKLLERSCAPAFVSFL